MSYLKAKQFPQQKKQPKPKKEFWVGDLKFDSGEEMRYYLKLESDPNVKEIRLQPEFEVMPPYPVRCYRCRGTGSTESPKTGNPVKCQLCKGTGKREGRNMIYTADFLVTYQDGYKEVIDVKGTSKFADNERFPLKKKLFEAATGLNLVVEREGTKEKRGLWLRDEK